MDRAKLELAVAIWSNAIVALRFGGRVTPIYGCVCKECARAQSALDKEADYKFSKLCMDALGWEEAMKAESCSMTTLQAVSEAAGMLGAALVMRHKSGHLDVTRIRRLEESVEEKRQILRRVQHQLVREICGPEE